MCLSVNNCCCCLTLEVGAKIISILSTVISAASILLYGTALLGFEELPAGRFIFYAIIVMISVLQFTFGCLLIYGAFARKPAFTWPWTAVTWCHSVLLVIMTVTGIILINYNREVETTAEISTVISVYFLYALLQFYFASIVHSRRQQMIIEGRTETAKRLLRHRVLPQYYI